MLKIRNLRKIYGNYHALDGLDMDIEDGSLYGFVGPNGAGKTTTIKIISGLLLADGGSVEIDGIDALAQPHCLKEKIGYVRIILESMIILKYGSTWNFLLLVMVLKD